MVVARLSFVKLKPDADLDEARKIWDESLTPAAMSQKGYVGTFMLVSEDNNEGIALSLWETKQDGDAGEASGYYQEQVKKFASILAAAPDRKYYKLNSNIVLMKE